jgi:hypothetical protein
MITTMKILDKVLEAEAQTEKMRTRCLMLDGDVVAARGARGDEPRRSLSPLRLPPVAVRHRRPASGIATLWQCNLM